MTPKQVIKYYGSIKETADHFVITYHAVHRWVVQNKIPAGRQWEIEADTRGVLKASNNSVK